MTRIYRHICLAAMLALAACGQEAPADDAEPGAVSVVVAELPVPHANNAVAAIPGLDGATLYSFNGLKAGKTFADTSSQAFACDIPDGACREIAGPPVSEGRLASTAIFLDGLIYLIGGYTVAEDGTEVSTPEVFAFNPATGEYYARADMPTPVDDAVAFVYRGRYIYLVSGWHDDGNVSLVQVYDASEGKWFSATDYPGAPVFGHSGGAVGGKFLIADGVAVVGEKDGRRVFGAVDEVWLGAIAPEDPARIVWQEIPAHPGVPLYRMAAMGDAARKSIVFFGGGDNPYNYNGIGYDGEPAKPSGLLFEFDLASEEWREIARADHASMDHRGLLKSGDAYYVIGGLDENQNVTGAVVRITPPESE